MRHILAVVVALGLMMPSALFAKAGLQDGGGGMGGGGGGGMDGGGKGPPPVPGGGKGPDPGEPSKGKDPKPGKPAELQAAPVALRAILDESKPPETLKAALLKVPGVKDVKVTDNEARLLFTGEYHQLVSLQKAAASVQIKAVLFDPGLFTVEFTGGKDSKAAMDALQKMAGVQRVFPESSSKILVVGPVKHIDPRQFATTLQEAGIKFVALRSHRLRTLSFEPWERGTRPERLRDRLLKVPGMLRADVDFAASTVTVLLMKETGKDLELVAAAEEAGFTLFPGKAEEEEEPAPAPPEPKK